MKVLGFDPAGNKFGVAGIEFLSTPSDLAPNGYDQSLSLYMNHLIAAPDSDWKMTQKTAYMAHVAASIVSLDKPDVVVSEKPWGMGFSKDSLLQLIGAIKAELWQDIVWQGVSEARRAVIGDSWGGANKKVTSDWLLQYPWDLSSKRAIKLLVETANPETDDGYDVLDAILHILCYLIVNKGLLPVVKQKKEKKKANKNKVVIS